MSVATDPYRKAADAAMYEMGTDWDEDEPDFPELDGPVFLLGTCAGGRGMGGGRGGLAQRRLRVLLPVLLPVLDAAVPGLDSQIAADALVGAFSTEYRCEQPGDAEVLGRIKRHSGDALENLATAGAVPPSDLGSRTQPALAHAAPDDTPIIHLRCRVGVWPENVRISRSRTRTSGSLWTATVCAP
jgi:hypothetical protein